MKIDIKQAIDLIMKCKDDCKQTIENMEHSDLYKQFMAAGIDFLTSHIYDTLYTKNEELENEMAEYYNQCPF